MALLYSISFLSLSIRLRLPQPRCRIWHLPLFKQENAFGFSIPERCLSDLKTNTGDFLSNLAVRFSASLYLIFFFPCIICCNSGLLLRTQVLREHCITAFFAACWLVVVLEVTSVFISASLRNPTYFPLSNPLG